jgi:hypothetical protein
MHVRVSYLDCHEAGLCCYLAMHIENYYVNFSCFNSICDLFTDSTMYIIIFSDVTCNVCASKQSYNVAEEMYGQMDRLNNNS